MSLSRRSFLKKSGVMAAGLTAASFPFLKACGTPEEETMPFGIQLYTLRDIIADDPRGILKQLSEFGYKQIESYEGPMGIYWQMGNIGFKNYLDELGMTLISTHANVFEDFERKVAEAAEIGVEHIISPWIGPQETLDDYRRIAGQFNELGRIASNAGLRFAYHNHAYTFELQEGEYPQDVLMGNTDPDLVDFQLDIYWVAAAGENPIDWIRKYPNRFVSSHVKDLANGDDPESVTLGTGTLDYQEILPVAKENGMKYFIVEQEAYTGTTPIDSARDNAQFMKQLRI
ncbi:MAG: TIM barrel protein [Balneolaceae bacterium]